MSEQVNPKHELRLKLAALTNELEVLEDAHRKSAEAVTAKRKEQSDVKSRLRALDKAKAE